MAHCAQRTDMCRCISRKRAASVSICHPYSKTRAAHAILFISITVRNNHIITVCKCFFERAVIDAFSVGKHSRLPTGNSIQLYCSMAAGSTFSRHISARVEIRQHNTVVTKPSSFSDSFDASGTWYEVPGRGYNGTSKREAIRIIRKHNFINYTSITDNALINRYLSADIEGNG